MTEQDALLAAIYANREDDTPRLVYADWLDDHGSPHLAAFTRCPHYMRHERESYGRWRWRWLARDCETNIWHSGVHTGLWPASELFVLPVGVRRKIEAYTFRHGFISSIRIRLQFGCGFDQTLRSISRIGTICPALEKVRPAGLTHPSPANEGVAAFDRAAFYRFQLGPIWDIADWCVTENLAGRTRDEINNAIEIAAALYARGQRLQLASSQVETPP